MKATFLTLLIFFLGTALRAVPAFAEDISKQIQSFELNVCTEQKAKCLKIQAEKAEGSRIGSVYAFSQGTVLWVQNNGSQRTEVFTSGHIDFGLNRLVYVIHKKDEVIEHVISLDDLSTQEFRIE